MRLAAKPSVPSLESSEFLFMVLQVGTGVKVDIFSRMPNRHNRNLSLSLDCFFRSFSPSSLLLDG